MGLFTTIAKAVAGPLIGGLFSADQASKNRSFQAQMSNTSYQRAMEDMKKAGLNPILAGKFGGASTPQGAMATMETPDFTSAFATEKQMEKTDIDIEKVEQEIENLDTQNQLTKAQIGQTATAAAKTAYEIQGVIEQTGLTSAKKAGQDQVNELRDHLLELLKSAEFKEMLGKLGKESNNVINIYTQYIGEWLGKTAFDSKEQAVKFFNSVMEQAGYIKGLSTKDGLKNYLGVDD
jgi:hypothetical protein